MPNSSTKKAKKYDLGINVKGYMNEMGRKIKMPAPKFKDWSFTPGTHMVEGRMKSQKLSSDFYMCATVSIHPK